VLSLTLGGMARFHVGIVGLGKMGGAFARRLLDDQYRVSVWDRTPQRMAAFTTTGAIPYTSLKALVSDVDVVIVMLWGDEVAREVTIAQIIPEMNPTQILIESSTLSPQMYETIEANAAERNISFVAAPVVGNPDQARTGSLTVLAGGKENTLRNVHDLLRSLGTVVEMHSVRASGYMKLANNMVLGVVAETLRELFQISERSGINFDLAAHLLVSTLQRVAGQKLPQLLARDVEPRFALEALLKDLRLLRGAEAPLLVSLPVLEAVIPQFERAVDKGIGARDYIALALEGTQESRVLRSVTPAGRPSI
jgi:3-hydroxyisobutyrate dehydrogenase